MNNPIRYTDPSGHRCVDSNVEGSCDAVDFKLTRNYIESNYAAKVRGRWKTDELLYLAESLDLLSDHAGGSENLNDVLRDGANKWGKDEVTFLRLPGLSRDTGNNHAAWCQGHSDKGCVPGAVVFSDDIFTQEYQYSRDRYRPSELGLYRNLSAGIKVSMIHEMTHVFEDARPAAARIYSWRVPGAYPDERMANTMAFYVVSGIENWPGKPANFDFVRDIQVLWQATP